MCATNLLYNFLSIIYVTDVFLALSSVEEEAWEPGVAIARMRIRFGGLGLTRFWPGVGRLLFPQSGDDLLVTLIMFGEDLF